jgi:hypothetical protein
MECYLLYRSYIYDEPITCIKESCCQHLERHISDSNMIQFLEIATNWNDNNPKLNSYMKKYGKRSSIDEFIHHFATRGKCIDIHNIGIDIIGCTNNLVIETHTPTMDISTNINKLLEIQNVMDNGKSDDMVPVDELDGPCVRDHIYSPELVSLPSLSVLSPSSMIDATPVVVQQSSTQSSMHSQCDEMESDNSRELETTLTNKPILQHDNITTFHTMDVIISSGDYYSNSQGNIHYRELLQSHYRAYKNAHTKMDQISIYASIMNIIYNLNGRFLRKDKTTGLWYKIDDETVQHQVIRAALSGLKRCKGMKCKLRQSTGTRIKVLDTMSKMNDWTLIPPSDVGIKTINDNDVLNGFSRLNESHPGNCRFRDLIHLHYNDHQNATSNYDKEVIYNRIIGTIRTSYGRFLCEKKCTGLWYEIGDLAARIRVQSALKRQIGIQKTLEIYKVQEIQTKDGTSTICDIDVLSGAGPLAYVNSGNRIYRANMDAYFKNVIQSNVCLDHIPIIAKQVVRKVYNTNGRFLALNEKTGLWYEMDHKAAIEKTYSLCCSRYDQAKATIRQSIQKEERQQQQQRLKKT